MYGQEAYGESPYGAAGSAGPALAPVQTTAVGQGSTATFGTPILRLTGSAVGFRTTVFSPLHYRPQNVTGAAAGFAPVGFGLAYHYVTGSASSASAPRPTVSLGSPRFGTPLLSAKGLALGGYSTVFGTPRARTFYLATAFVRGSLGVPAALSGYTAWGFRAGTSGAHTARVSYLASGARHRPSRWGAPRSTVSFGAVGTTADSWETTLWGAPSSGPLMQRATPVPPTYRFGRPLLRRTDLC